MKRPHLKAFICLAVALVLGYFIAAQVNAFLGIEFNPKSLPDVPAHQVVKAAPPAEFEPIAALVLPGEAAQDDLYQRAAAALADTVEAHTGGRPEIVTAPETPPEGRVIAVGSGERNSFVQASLPDLSDPDSFTFQPYQQDDYQMLAILGASRAGDVYGMYYLADMLHAGGEAEVFSLKRTVSPAML